MRYSAKPRYIKAESITIGSIIRVTWSIEDVEKSIVGRVASRQHHARETLWETASGHILLTRDSGMRTCSVDNTYNPTITLLEPAPEMITPQLDWIKI